MSTTRPAWRELWQRGWSLVPLEPHGKRARVAWKPYQTKRADADTMRAWLEQWPDANPGVVTGRVSGIIVLDVDGAEGESSLQGKQLPLTPYVCTAKGRHYYFAYPPLSEGQRVVTDAGVLPGLDSRGDGGYVAGPGAIHETGVIYTWGVTPDEIAPAPAPDWWLSLVLTADEDPRDAAPTYTVPARLDAEGEERARKYCLAALEGEVDKVRASFDGEKHRRLLYSAVALGGFVPVLREHEIEAALYDAIRDRARDRRGARKTIRDGIDYGMRRPREIPEPSYRESGSLSGQDDEGPTVFENEEPPHTAEAEAQGAAVREGAANVWVPVPITELEAEEEHTEWLWEGYIAPGMLSLLGGQPKAGKTTLLAYLLCAMGAAEGAGPAEFAGRRVASTRALIVSEEHPRHWLDRRDNIGIGGNVSLICRPFVTRPTQKEWEARVKYLVGRCVEDGYTLAVFDSLPNLWPVRDENNNPELVAALMPLVELSRAGVAVLGFMHPSRADRPAGEGFRGGGASLGFADILIDMRLFSAEDFQDTRRVLSVKGRFGMFEQVLEFEEGWGYASVGTRQEAQREQRRAVMWSVMPLAGPGWTVEEILSEWPDDKPKPGKGALRSDLDYLAREGVEVIRTGEGTRSDPYRYYHAAGNRQWARTRVGG